MDYFIEIVLIGEMTKQFSDADDLQTELAQVNKILYVKLTILQ